MNAEIIDTTSPPELPPRRPTFLTVLCILTFVVSGYSIFEDVINLFIADEFANQDWQLIMSEAMEGLDDADPEAARFLQNIMDAASVTVQNAVNNALALTLISIVVAILSALGALYMFRLRRSGFWVYVFAKVIGIIVPLAILGVNLLTLLVFGFATLIGAVFVVLYAVNLKHMR